MGNDDRMGSHITDFTDATVKTGQRIIQHGCAGRAGMPAACCKTLLHGTRTTAENIGKFMLAGMQDIDGQYPVFENIGMCPVPRLIQTSTVGGVSDTLHTADAVKPCGPWGPSVVTTVTALASAAMPLRKASTGTAVTSDWL